MPNITITAKRLIVASFVFCCLAFAIGSFFIISPLQFALGIAVGFIGTIIRIILIERSILSSVDMDKKSAENYARLRFFMRNIFAFIIMLLCALYSPICLIGAVLGSISMQFGAYAVRLLNR